MASELTAQSPGTECEMFAADMAAGYSRGALPLPMGFSLGPESVASGWPQWGYHPQAPRTLQDGDVIQAEVFCNFGGHHTQNQVMITVGKVHEDTQPAAKVARAVLLALRVARRSQVWRRH